MDPNVLLPAYLATALGLVVIPVTACAIAEARAPRSVTCPANQQPATVRLSAGREVLRLISDARARIAGCSRWPERAGCDQACAAGLA